MNSNAQSLFSTLHSTPIFLSKHWDNGSQRLRGQNSHSLAIIPPWPCTSSIPCSPRQQTSPAHVVFPASRSCALKPSSCCKCQRKPKLCSWRRETRLPPREYVLYSGASISRSVNCIKDNAAMKKPRVPFQPPKRSLKS